MFSRIAINSRPAAKPCRLFPPRSNSLAEPAKRDTAPAAAFATAYARVRDGGAICALLPADSMVHDTATFQRQLREAAQVVRDSDALLTFAIPPSFAATGYGYLKLTINCKPRPKAARSPRWSASSKNLIPTTAEEYVASGAYGWNAGMFVWRAGAFLIECERLLPPLAEFIRAFPVGDPSIYLAERFEHLPKISVDYAIMEQAKDVLAIKAEFDWDDVGSWTALPAHLGRDATDNTIKGAHAVIDSHNNIVVANSRTIALCGVSDLVVIETADAVLVCHRNAVQRIKNLQPHLPRGFALNTPFLFMNLPRLIAIIALAAGLAACQKQPQNRRTKSQGAACPNDARREDRANDAGR